MTTIACLAAVLPTWLMFVTHLTSLDAPDSAGIPAEKRRHAAIAAPPTVGTMHGCEQNLHLPGWPARVGTGGARLNSLVIGDIGFTPGKEAITMSTRNLRVLSTEGVLLFSHRLGLGSANNVPSLADLDNDGLLEVVMGSSEGFQVLDDGKVETIVPGREGHSLRPYVLEDLDRDGEIEVVYVQGDGILHVRDRFGTELKGWPVQPLVPGEGEGVYVSSPVVGDLDGDGEMEVIIQLLRGPRFGPINDVAPTIFALTLDGSAMWSREVPHDHINFDPGSQDSTWFNDVVLGDVDNDGHLEVVYLRYGEDTKVEANIVYVLDHLGGMQAEWCVPFSEAHIGRMFAQLALGDLDGDGDLEIAAAAYTNPFSGNFVYVWHHDGTLVNGYPARIPNDSDRVAAPMIADVDGDGSADIVSSLYQSRNNFFNRVYAWGAAGEMLDCWPKELIRTFEVDFVVLPLHSETTLADLDANGTVDLIAPIGSGEAHAIDLGVPMPSAQLHWPMFRHDLQRTGRYEPPALLCRADLDADGIVGFEDLISVLAAWGNDGGPEDLDADGLVGFGDLLALLEAWGPCE